MIFRLRGPIFNHSVSSGSASSGPVEIFSRKNYLPPYHVLFHRIVYLRGTGRRQPGLVILSRFHTSSLPRPHRNIFFGEGSGDIKRHFVAPDVRNKLARILCDTASIGHRFEIPNPGRIAGVSELEQLARLRPISETISPVNTRLDPFKLRQIGASSNGTRLAVVTKPQASVSQSRKRVVKPNSKQ